MLCNGDSVLLRRRKAARNGCRWQKKLRFIYDVNGIAGVKEGTIARYTYIKDGQNNIVGLATNGELIAKYVYDAWGNGKALDRNNREITDKDHIAVLNPIRWKSQFYDTDSKLYMLGGRYYDSLRSRYISAASPELLLKDGSQVFGILIRL